MSSVETSELREALEQALVSVGIEGLAEVRREPSPYRTSFPLEQVEATLASGEVLSLAWKRLDREELEPIAQAAKPAFLQDPAREPAVYSSLLAAAPPGPPRYFGSVQEPGRHWLFVEWVEGRELYQVGERELWEAAARWLGRFHAAMADEAERHAAEAHLVVHDAAYYRHWVQRAQEFAGDQPQDRAKAIARLAECHDPVIEALTAEPDTILHGEFYASNVLVTDTRVAPVDWEVAGLGPGLTDLAALVSGGWSQADREAIAGAYATAADASLANLDYARLQLAIQWLGWAPPSWEPPEGQRQDWLAEALELAERLGL
jgi:Phosphotransferase enzyme family